MYIVFYAVCTCIYLQWYHAYIHVHVCACVHVRVQLVCYECTVYTVQIRCNLTLARTKLASNECETSACEASPSQSHASTHE